MPTHTTRLHVRRSGHPRRLLLLASGLMMGLLVMLAVGSVLAGASDPPCKDQATSAVFPTSHEHAVPAAASRASGREADGPGSTGVDLELRVGHLRIEFPWLKSLPVNPGRRIVISLFSVAES
jgi:hypothetical protein